MSSHLSKSPSYLVRNAYSYCFRMYIPNDLQSLIGKKELRRSLKTGYLGLAKSKARLYAGRMQLLFRYLRGNERLKTMDQDELNKALNSYIAECFNWYEDRIIDPPNNREYEITMGSRKNIEQYIRDLPAIKADMAIALNQGDFSAVYDDADRLINKFSLTGISKDSPEYCAFCIELIKIQMEMLDVEKRKMAGDFSDKLEAFIIGMETHSNGGSNKGDKKPTEPSSITFEEVLEEYIAEASKAKDWELGTFKAYNALKKYYQLILGKDKPISILDRPTSVKFKEILMKLPVGTFRYNTTKGKSVDEVLKMPNIKPLEITTVNGYITNLSAVCEYAKRHHGLIENHLKFLKIPIKRKNPQSEQNSFDDHDLKIIFHAEDYINDTHDKPSRFWVPILGLYTGCRLEEICQLYIDDIEKVDNVCAIYVNESRDDQSLKNNASERYVPLHPFIVKDLRFIKYVERLKGKGELRLFPELNYYQGKFSHYVSRWFGDWKRKAGIVAPSRRKTFHSFRHNFTDNLKQQLIEATVIDELTGHVVQGESMGRYGKRYKVPVLYKKGILKLKYNVDLKHLKKSKYCG